MNVKNSKNSTPLSPFTGKFTIGIISSLIGSFLMTGSYAASYLPWILIPVVTWLLPVVVMGLLFLYIEREDPTGI